MQRKIRQMPDLKTILRILLALLVFFILIASIAEKRKRLEESIPERPRRPILSSQPDEIQDDQPETTSLPTPSYPADSTVVVYLYRLVWQGRPSPYVRFTRSRDLAVWANTRQGAPMFPVEIAYRPGLFPGEKDMVDDPFLDAFPEAVEPFDALMGYPHR